MFSPPFSDGTELMSSECPECQMEREKRARVIPRQGETDQERKRLDRIKEDCKKDPFVEAPAIYAYNVPKWSTLLLRAREYAKQTQQCLCWPFAHERCFIGLVMENSATSYFKTWKRHVINSIYDLLIPLIWIILCLLFFYERSGPES